ncbi:hypothetical protein [Bordetella pseudohinzii]|uniref:Uncharacterized protein n=1 Tax=Bordetella pseudohinzii TaxID=1331258 RepID=A0A0J6C2I6_9BORD|nr:hypothetical protein [Bordetella pseudohinzii]ANY16261.1 hypothetical protein BBN53_10355 [Bordetella pseudohinzii]KMM25238.1 hypothetical protein L540_20430 [Bordetella pseudohinzii]KXA75962.1 hypothetical protein AW877_18315 [Bordetella pseudohinzii]KXA77991.1 hypothetical protein AW878_13970 [Bordetella pseudohinzii]CUJ14742.1 Uncharacterised protein [Bordetella pseudohinzii]
MPLSPSLPTIFLYTEEQRGKQLVESEVVGMFSDVSGADKLVVIRDPHTRLQFVYRVEHDSNNLDAVAITELDAGLFDGKHSTQINAMSYRLGNPASALKLLRGKTQWIQDKGAVLSVLLQNAAARSASFSLRRIHRDRIDKVPPGVPVEHLPREAAEPQADAPWLAPEGDKH